jgi:hypothetical protein
MMENLPNDSIDDRITSENSLHMEVEESNNYL